MPPIFGANSASITLAAIPTNPRPAAPGHSFQARQGRPRPRKWRADTRTQQSEPFALLRADHASTTRKASRCRGRIAGIADRLLDRTRRTSPAASALDPRSGKQETQESRTALQACARQVNAIGRQYGNGDRPVRLTADIVHDLINLSNSMKMLRRHDQDPADFLYPAVRALHEASTGTAAATRQPPLPNLLRDLASLKPGDPAGLRAQLTRKGGGLDIWLANNLSPFYEQSPDAARRGMAGEMNLLLDGLAGAARQVLREQLLARVPAWAGEARPGLFQEAKILYTSAQRWRGNSVANDDLAGDRATSGALADDASTPGALADNASAHGAFAGDALARRASARRASAGHTLPGNGGNAILQASPADAVGILLDKAAQQALGTASTPAGNLAPLLGVLSKQLSRTAAHIDASLHTSRVADYTPAGEVAALRQELMREVLRETGILHEIDRLQQAGSEAAADSMPVARSAGRDAPAATPTALPAFRPNDAAPHPSVAKRMKRAAANARREIANFLSVCQLSNDKTWRKAKEKSLPAHKLAALHEARKALEAVHGTAVAQDIWRVLVDGAVASAKDDELVTLNTGALWTFAHPDPGLAATLANLDGGDRILDELWTSVRTESAKRHVGPALRKWCETLSAPPDMADSKELFRQVDALRGQVDVLKDNKVDTATLLSAAMAWVDDRGLGILIDTLAWPSRPAADTPADAGGRPPEDIAGTATLRHRVMQSLGGNYRGLNLATGLPDRDAKNARVFLNHLFNAACTESEKRMDILRDGLVNDFRIGLFTQANRMHAMLATPEAGRTNGPATATLEQLLKDAVKHGRLIHEHGEDAAAARMGTRFLRTVHGYDTASAMTSSVHRDTASLHARLDGAMKQLNITGFRSDAVMHAWRDSAVDYIVRETGVWDRIDTLAQRLPTIGDGPFADAPQGPGAIRPVAAVAGNDGYSTILDPRAGDKPAVPPKPRMTTGPSSMPPLVSARHSYMVPKSLPTHDGHRVSTAVSDDSGFDDGDRSQLSLDSPLHGAPGRPPVLPYDPPSSLSPAPSVASFVSATSISSFASATSISSFASTTSASSFVSATSVSSIAAMADAKLITSLRTALEQRRRGALNYA